MSPAGRPKPLAGVRVLDLTRLLPGPLCSQHLADMGADVIKIESPPTGDPMRQLGQAENQDSPLFAMLNRNKRSIRLDLKQPEGVDVFKRLAARSEVVIEGFRPGVADRLGIGYRVIGTLNPRIVYCAISGYGQTGEYRDRAGHDLNYLALTGIVEQSGRAGHPPSMLNFQIADVIGGTLSAAMGILAALLDARSSDRGRFVDVSMSDCALAHAVFPLAALIGAGASAERGRDTLTGGLPCYNLYETADARYMAVGALERKFWDRLCAAVDRLDLQPHHVAVGETGDWAKKELAAVFRDRNQAHWIGHFESVDCCVTPVLAPGETLRDKHFRQRGMFLTAPEEPGRVTGPAFPVRFDEFEFGVERQAPGLGEHGADILRDLGFDEDEISNLQDKSVV